MANIFSSARHLGKALIPLSLGIAGLGLSGCAGYSDSGYNAGYNSGYDYPGYGSPAYLSGGAIFGNGGFRDHDHDIDRDRDHDHDHDVDHDGDHDHDGHHDVDHHGDHDNSHNHGRRY